MISMVPNQPGSGIWSETSPLGLFNCRGTDRDLVEPEKWESRTFLNFVQIINLSTQDYAQNRDPHAICQAKAEIYHDFPWHDSM
jgi:hypothetical protein